MAGGLGADVVASNTGGENVDQVGSGDEGSLGHHHGGALGQDGDHSGGSDGPGID